MSSSSSSPVEILETWTGRCLSITGNGFRRSLVLCGTTGGAGSLVGLSVGNLLSFLDGRLRGVEVEGVSGDVVLDGAAPDGVDWSSGFSVLAGDTDLLLLNDLDFPLAGCLPFPAYDGGS